MRPALQHAGDRVVAIDLLGFGGSEKPGSGYSIEDQAELVAQALSRLGVRRATVVGHSLGGAVVVALAEQAPDLVERLVIIDQAPDDEDYGPGLPFTAQLTFLPVIGPALWRITPDFAIKDGLGAAFAPGYDVPDEFVEDFRRQTYTSYDEAGSAEDDFLKEEPLDRRVEGTGVPLLAIFGAEDQIFESRKALAAYAKVPGVRTALVRGAGHSPNVEKPAQTATLILAFASVPVRRQARPAGHRVQEAVQEKNPVRPRP
jgi:pimeloyl-ACP methyl ester carboxylesterase